ncbi:MAG: tRNA (N6-isopentenyl adenosine(37)-C2)-methylthiotransferase MiaB [Proteobacteria bacterium]|nr:tRNA (N6-isopentenyl adenosine(37)-C2)-methylthiotransferase MiaB [Pseudomonadota bacterium]MBU1709511.1 tRNA (N6-isopentenyl adenosine(37)-C2)-methylthiotransferase MiaB [Pseudomonadota bacterium]
MKRVYIETFGCQMNERDSEIMSQLLVSSGYIETFTITDADLVLVNTCSVREKAEQKAYSLLGTLKKMKVARPSLLVAVAGCVAQQDGAGMLKRMPHVDLIIGPQNIYRLPELLEKASDQTPKKQIATNLSNSFVIPPFLPNMKNQSTFKRFVTIMQGCNNFCTYCVVPFTRGREVSRKKDDIINEIKHLIDNGIKEITLLGQNVNSYGLDRPNEQDITFPDLLRAASEVKGLERIRFTTSHPKDLSEDLMRCFQEIKTLCPHLHLPVQSGSNTILKQMNRKYTIEKYLDKVSELRKYNPEIAITTDIIVGFPGEKDEDFEATMQLLESVRYHGAFSFKYSDRPHTKSASFSEKVPENEKTSRLARLKSRQDEINLERHRQYIGRKMKIMIEGTSKASDGQWTGRTMTNHIVNFDGNPDLQAGQIITVIITETCQNSLQGKQTNDFNG